MSNIENFLNTAKKDIALIKTIQKTKFSEVYECRLDGKDAVLKIKTDCTFENEIGIEEIIVDQLHKLNLAPQILHADTEKKVVIYEKVVGSDLSTVSKANIISKCAKQLKNFTTQILFVTIVVHSRVKLRNMSMPLLKTRQTHYVEVLSSLFMS